MSAISQIASRLRSSGRRTGTARPTTGAPKRKTGAPGAGSSKDKAIGRGVRGVVGRLRK